MDYCEVTSPYVYEFYKNRYQTVLRLNGMVFRVDRCVVCCWLIFGWEFNINQSRSWKVLAHENVGHFASREESSRNTKHGRRNTGRPGKYGTIGNLKGGRVVDTAIIRRVFGLTGLPLRRRTMSYWVVNRWRHLHATLPGCRLMYAYLITQRWHAVV